MSRNKYEVTPEGWAFFTGVGIALIAGLYKMLTVKPAPAPVAKPKKPCYTMSNIPFYDREY